MKTSSPRKGQALIDTLLALTIVSIMMTNLATASSDIQERTRAISIAHALSDMEKPVRAYVDSNYQTLMTVIPVNQTVSVPMRDDPSWNAIGDVLSSSVLPTSWSPNLPMGQIMHLLIKHTPATSRSPEHLASLIVSSGGNPMNDRQVGIATSAITSGMAGGIYAHSHAGSSSSIQGVSGAWQENVSSWSGGVPLTYGHVALYLNAVQSTAPYLNRYNIGNSEANRMHTSVDVNSNDLNNVRAMTGVNNMRNTGAAGAVNFHSGINTCLDNQTGCGVSISDDGGFYDYNDCWITLTNGYGNYGLHLSGSGNGSGNLWADGYGKFQENLSSRGYDPNDLPTLYGAGKWYGGLRTHDIVATATIATTWGNDNGGVNNLSAVMNSSGFRLGDHLDAWNNSVGHTAAEMRSNGDIYAAGKIGSLGYQPGQGDPPGWGGGLSTWDVASHGTIAAGVDGNGTANVFLGGFYNGQDSNDHKSHGMITASERIKGQVLHPTYIATQGDSCSGVAYGEFGNHYQYPLDNGDIATDSHGSLLSCVDGTWTKSGSSFNRVLFSDNRWAWTNNTGSPVFVVFSGEFSGGKRDNPDWSVFMNGASQGTIRLCHIFNNTSGNYVSGGGSCDVMVPDGFTIWKTGNANPTMTGIGP